MQIQIDGANRTRVFLNNGTTLFISYTTCVGARIGGEYFRTEKVWSRTTSKMLGEWGISKAPTKPQEFFDNLFESV